jgi:hypothetical protein
VITAESQEVKLPRLLVSDARAFHTHRAYSNSRRFEEVLVSSVPKGEGPGAPSSWLEKITGTGATRRKIHVKMFSELIERMHTVCVCLDGRGHDVDGSMRRGVLQTNNSER